MSEYQEQAMVTAIYPAVTRLIYPVLGLASEAGEVAGKLKKVIRDGNGTLTCEQRIQLIDELGDVLWYVAAVAHDMDVSLGEVAARNLDKLRQRQERGTLKGSGDVR